jgi:predicted phage tail protein
MNGRKPAVFVQQRTYRRRRMADAARLLPIVGGILFMIPLLWIDAGSGTRTAAVMVYLFVVWAGLAMIAGVLSRRLGPDRDNADKESDR